MQANIIDYGMNAEGVAKENDFIYFVPYALVGEKVEIEIERLYKNYADAKLKSILSPSSKRRKPPCPYFYDCGGCSLQHASYSEQLRYKSLLVKKTIKKIAELDCDVSPTVPSDKIFHYRNKASFNFSVNSAGFFKQKSKEIVDISNCLILNENINKVYTIFLQYLNDHRSIRPNIKNLVVRAIDNQILIGIVAKIYIDCTDFYETLKKHFESIGLYLVVNTRNDSVVLSGKTFFIAGTRQIAIENFDLKYSIDLLSFHQTNINIQNKIYTKVLDYIQTDEIVINAFSGAGLLSAICARRAKFVYGVEIEKSSHIEAEKLVKNNKIKNVKNILGDFNLEYKKINKIADTIILDPAKKGCGKDILRQIIGIKSIIYISCNPIALSKDLQFLKNDYIIEEIIPYDMFPNTNQVETLVKLKFKGEQ